MFRYLDESGGQSKEENLLKSKELLESLPAKIKEIKFYEIGVGKQMTASSCDLCLISGFDSWDDLNVYREHPEHRKVVDFINSVKSEVFSSDYEY
jgi:hypothetical protein